RLGEPGGNLLLQPLDAGAHRRQAFGVAAGRTCLGARLRVAAVVAQQHPTETMLDQPRRAVRALEAMTTGAAEREWRIAAPVDEEKRLLAAGDGFADRLDKRRRQEAPAFGLILAQID